MLFKNVWFLKTARNITLCFCCVFVTVYAVMDTFQIYKTTSSFKTVTKRKIALLWQKEITTFFTLGKNGREEAIRDL